ncbi:MAG TPA: hypothetical protein VJT08_09540 [Terriglobales bacterium]|nr:hypothetical protein [Terriglobales bacterium]
MEASDEKESPEFGVPLLCHVSRADQLKLANFLEMLKRLPCGLVAGKSLMSVVILAENAFRPYNGRLTGQSALIFSVGSILLSHVYGIKQAHFAAGGGAVWDTPTLQTFAAASEILHSCHKNSAGGGANSSHLESRCQFLAGKLPIIREGFSS